MTIEEKARAYDKALKWMRELYPGLHGATKEDAEHYFPELRESEDERIRKSLVLYFEKFKPQDMWDERFSIGDVLAYLEKQKDHFRDDTKMVEKQDYSSLNDLERAIHRGFLSAGVENAPVTLIKETAKECLEQMKPAEINVKALLAADRLASAEMTGRLKERSEILENPEKYGLQKPAENISQLTVKGKGVYKICPHCKERMVRDDSMVYTSMPPQYGYNCPKCGTMEFDTVMYDSPEMEEQTPAEWSEEDVVFLNEIIDFFENGTVRLQHDLSMYAHWLKSLPERFVLQPKAEWSDEDEMMVTSIVDVLKRFEHQGATDMKVDWLRNKLKSLRPQHHWKPSEQEKGALRTAIHVLTEERNFPKAAERLQAILDAFEGKESRKDFKPSEEQMNCLCAAVDAAIRKHNESVSGYEPARVLKSLYEQLKKLM